jgi:hypothetical protein
MTVCTRCLRPLKHPTATGMGPVCAKAARAQPVEAVERDLFGYDLDKAVRAIRHQFRTARVALLGWQP